MKLDIGCGTRKAEGYEGVDILAFDGVDHVIDVRVTPWPWADEEVEEVISTHFVEHLTQEERLVFWDELWRVMKIGAKANISVPHWSHACAYGDPTHKWPPMSEWAFYYLNKDWRSTQAPHTPLKCDFDFASGGSWDPWLENRSMAVREYAMQHYVNSWRDLIVTLTKRAPS